MKTHPKVKPPPHFEWSEQKLFRTHDVYRYPDWSGSASQMFFSNGSIKFQQCFRDEIRDNVALL